MPPNRQTRGTDSAPLVGGIEAGGTKFVCAVGRPPKILALKRFPTRSPERTLADVVAFFEAQPERPQAIGIGAFGPVDVHAQSATFGFITDTPKAGWAHTEVAGVVSRRLGIPVAFDTDVNAAALAEYRWGAGRGMDVLLYLTVGTGIGGGALVDGHPVHGLMHPEMGHLFVARAPGDHFMGICPHHSDCLEGLAAGPALQARWGRAADTLPPDHEAWTFETHYLALAVTNLILAYSPRRVILGGGVMQQIHLFPAIRTRVQEHLAGYINRPAITQAIDTFIVPPALGGQAGVLGAMALTAPLDQNPDPA